MPTDRAERPDPAEDPRVCSVCGVYIGYGGSEYCDSCAREIGAKPRRVRCEGCGDYGDPERMEPIDVSPEGTYYPDIRHLCASCSGGAST